MTLLPCYQVYVNGKPYWEPTIGKMATQVVAGVALQEGYEPEIREITGTGRSEVSEHRAQD